MKRTETAISFSFFILLKAEIRSKQYLSNSLPPPRRFGGCKWGLNR